MASMSRLLIRNDVRNHNYNYDDITHNHRGNESSNRNTGESVNLLFDSSDGESEKSSDSDKTDDPRYPWDLKTMTNANGDGAVGSGTGTSTPAPKYSKPMNHDPRKTAQESTPASRSTEVMTAMIQESPTTKALISFSQNMDDLRCEPCFGSSNHDGAATALVMSKSSELNHSMSYTIMSPTAPYDLPHGYEIDWEIHPIHIVAPIQKDSSSCCAQVLGIVIARGAFPASVNQSGYTQKNHCVIKQMHEDGIAARSGLKPGDWFLSPTDANTISLQLSLGEPSSNTNGSASQQCDTDSSSKLATFEEIQKWSKEFFPDHGLVRVVRRRATSDTKSNQKQSSLSSGESHSHNNSSASSNITNSAPTKIAATSDSTWVKMRGAKDKSRSTSALNGTATTAESSGDVLVESFPSASTMAIRVSHEKAKFATKSDDSASSNSSGARSKSVPPYCVLCNYYNPTFWSENTIYGKKRTKPTRPPRNHHSWCPQNKTFDTKRVEKLLARMKHCHRVLGCKACHMEYQTGKVISIKKKRNNSTTSNFSDDNIAEMILHNTACLRYQDKLKKEERLKRKREVEKEKERKEQAKNNKREEALPKEVRAKKKKPNHSARIRGRTASNGRKKRRAARCDDRRTRAVASDHDSSSNSTSSSNCCYSDEDDGCDGSVYQPPARKTQLEAFTFPRKCSDFDSIKGNSALGKTSKVKTSRSHTSFDKKLHLSNRSTSREKIHGGKNKKDQPASGVSGDPIQNSHDRGNGQVKPVWVSIDDDPWGEEGYQTGDVLLFGPQLGIGHHETHITPNQRYKVDPFGGYSTYRTTHCTPEEGLALIILKRDPLGRMPWGFKPIRDEFGQACLVETVDPCSPASAATFLGVPTSGSNGILTSATSTISGRLSANDMIVAINGKPVGGMTIAGLELELEACAPNLLLAVSRYKHAENVAQKFADMERKMLNLMDRAARDDRLLGWREIGCGDGVKPRSINTKKLSVERTVPSLLLPRHPETKDLNESSSRGSIRNDDDSLLLWNKEAAEVEEPDLPESIKLKKKIGKEKRLEHRVAGTEQQTKIIFTKDQESQIRPMSSTGEQLQPEILAGGYTSSGTSEDSAAHDQNPQMGCVCGADHSSSHIKTFWIQCESCNSWYHVAERCIGFADQQANRPNFIWNCAACIPDMESVQERSLPDKCDGHTDVSQLDKVKECNLQKNRCKNQKNTEGAKQKEDSIFVDDSGQEICSNHIDGGDFRSSALFQTASKVFKSESLAHVKVSKPEQSILEDGQLKAYDNSSNALRSVQPLLENSANLINNSRVLSQASTKGGYGALNSYQEVDSKSTLTATKKQCKIKKDEAPLLLRQLKSHNKNGLSYWDDFELQQLPCNPNRCLRKRRAEKRSLEQNCITRDNRLNEDKSSDNEKSKLQKKAKRSMNCPIQKHLVSKDRTSDASVSPTSVSGNSNRQITIPIHNFEVGDLVHVESHAWAYVNNSGGIGKIQKAYNCEDGDRVYDVWYPVLDRTEKGILAEFISSYSFD